MVTSAQGHLSDAFGLMLFSVNNKWSSAFSGHTGRSGFLGQSFSEAVLGLHTRSSGQPRRNVLGSGGQAAEENDSVSCTRGKTPETRSEGLGHLEAWCPQRCPTQALFVGSAGPVSDSAFWGTSREHTTVPQCAATSPLP